MNTRPFLRLHMSGGWTQDLPLDMARFAAGHLKALVSVEKTGVVERAEIVIPIAMSDSCLTAGTTDVIVDVHFETSAA